MANVFVNPYSGTQPKSWSLQKCFIYMTDGEGGAIDQETGVLAATESVQISYARPLDKRYPLTTGSPITLMGVPQGTCSITTILGPGYVVDTFLKKFGSTCKPFTLEVGVNKSARVDEECPDAVASAQTFILRGCQGQGMTFTLSTQNGLVIAQGSFQIQFDELDWKTSN